MAELARRGLRALTPARVALPSAGDSIALTEVLDFQLAHALARDAVYAVLDAGFATRLGALGEVLELRTQAPDRATYLRRPDLGRALHVDSAALLAAGAYDLAVVVADGLSALAVERYAIPLLALLLPELKARGWHIAPLAVVRQGRVAIADQIAHSLGARASLVLLGERPGLSAADSMGAYLTWSPGSMRNDADRNCLSNIRSGGLPPEPAAGRLLSLMEMARTLGKTGTTLKEGNELERMLSGKANSLFIP
jgi:ethanolamine ammonia-lyase small subunit